MLTACGGAARAQVPPTHDNAEDIVVTAQRRAEPLAHVAAPVSAVTGDQLRNAHATTLSDLERFFPELTVQPTGTGNLLFVRGVGNFTLQPNSDPAVGLAYDGVMVARPSGTMAQLFDIDRVELLKGPQGVLYGRNAAAGSINVEPRQPVLGARQAFGQATIGDYGERRFEAAVNAPIGSAAAVRLSGALSNHGPYLRGYMEGDRQQSMRAQVKVAPSPRLSLRLAADYSHSGGIGPGSSYVGKYRFSAADKRFVFEDAGLPLSEGLYSAASQEFRQGIFLPGIGRNLDALASVPSQDNRIYGAHLHADLDMPFAKLMILAAGRRVSLKLVNSGSPFGLGIRERDEQESLEARLSGRRGAVDWIAGTLFFGETIDSNNTTNLSSSLILSGQKYRTSSSAFFGNVEWHYAPFASVSAGLRWTEDRKRFSGESDTLTLICTVRIAGVPSCPLAPLFPLVDNFADQSFPVPVANGPALPLLSDGTNTGAVISRRTAEGSGRLSTGDLDWRVAAKVEAWPHTLIYATVETGHRPGGFNVATGFETFGPERLTAFNLGLRHRYGERIQVDAEAFWWRYRDQQVSALRPDLGSPVKNANITANIGDSSIRGVEVTALVAPWQRARVRAVVQYLEAAYRSFSYLQANTNVPPLTGCAIQLDPSTNLYTVDCSSKQPFNSPRWSLLLSAQQSVPLGRFLATAGVAYRFRSTRNISFALLPEMRIGPGGTTDIRLELRPRQGRWSVAAFIDNVEGRRTPDFMIFHPVSNALIAGTTAPRRFGVTFAVEP